MFSALFIRKCSTDPDIHSNATLMRPYFKYFSSKLQRISTKKRLVWEQVLSLCKIPNYRVLLLTQKVKETDKKISALQRLFGVQ